MGITAQELRIGNYINGSIGDDSKLVLCSVTGYDPRDEFIFVSNDNNIHYAEFVDFQPIPLTEERLLKFGEKYGNEWHFNGIVFEQFEDGLFYSGGEGIKLSMKAIKYVHELQNFFFALKGEELTI